MVNSCSENWTWTSLLDMNKNKRYPQINLLIQGRWHPRACTYTRKLYHPEFILKNIHTIGKRLKHGGIPILQEELPNSVIHPCILRIHVNVVAQLLNHSQRHGSWGTLRHEVEDLDGMWNLRHILFIGTTRNKDELSRSTPTVKSYDHQRLRSRDLLYSLTKITSKPML